ncbi:MAG: YidC/Oxa1 family membrane protein insertase [Fimbriimonadaceae bacterium]
MSTPAPPKNQWMNMLMLGMVIFLGIQLIMAPQKANQDTRKPEEIWAKMVEDNRDLKDVSIQKELAKYQETYLKQADANGASQAEKDAQILRANLLVVDTMHKSGQYRGELFKSGKVSSDWAYRKLDKAYTFIKPKYETFYHTPLWESVTVAVAPTPEYPKTETNAKDLYNTLVKDISPLAKNEPVFGFIPGYQLIDVLVQVTGVKPGFSYWFAALLLALVVRAIVWPLAQKQIMHGRQMMLLQPRIKEIQEKYKDKKTGQTKDPAAFQAETMGIYKEYGINPAAGCLPAFIQMPLFLAVYQSMHHYKFEFTKGTFLWVNELSGKFIGIPLGANLGERDYILVFIYMLSMISTTLLMPVSDPSNAKQQRIMGVGIAFVFSIFMFFYTLPSAFVLYWIFTNVLSTAQSLLSYRLPVPELKKTQTVAGGKVIDSSSSSNGHANGEISPDFFGKKGTPKANKQRKRKK